MLKNNKIYRTLISFVAVSALFALSAYSHPTYALSVLKGGDFMQAFNNTTQEGTWRDPVDALPGDVIEYRITVTNIGDEPAHDVQVWGSVTGQVPQTPSKQLVITGRINNQSYGGTTLTDTATVNILGDTPVGMSYYVGHARLQGVTSLYNCPTACTLSDDVTKILGGFDIGDVAPGATVEIAFKGSLSVGVPSPSPSPSVSPSASPSVSPSVSPSASPSSPAVVKQVTPPTNELPNTGLPLAGLALTGLLPAGVGIRKFGKKTVESLSANSLWEDREMKR